MQNLPAQASTALPVALVTGASRGIGRAIAIQLAKAGYWVIGTATSTNGAAAITDYLSTSDSLPAGSRGQGVVLDVTDAVATEALIEKIQQDHGALAVLVNNAGITNDNLALRLKDEDWDRVLDTNLKAVFRVCRAAMRGMMKARTGRIINISSVVASSGNPGQANYCAAKAGLEGMTRALARELGSRQITVNCIAPGFIATDMTNVLSEAQTSKLKEQIPLGRMGEPDEIAAAVVFLAGAAASYITGQVLHVNGGMYM
ncbi:3-oxoacyl-ACP reductase FabG [Parvibium lacunae]|uniref:3-oxoacyl-[acyl-carrier-protein] reductase n=1 Tax=Parvibium lacunae TaxID=1888893 RepID=A0A368L3S8_9BURK|nr:3-oxoacyl-ACP reductase FabG [Parvibium lacunae]RCS58237.1 3-oxoacyl-ACP reductase FabG [Parvibium lacunae]